MKSTSKNTHRKLSTFALVAAGATIAGSVVLAPAASAVGGYSISGGTWNVRSSVGGAVVASVKGGQAVSIDCQVVGPAVTVAGFGTSTIYNRLTGIGYVSDLAIRETPYQARDSRLPDCNAPAPAAPSTPAAPAAPAATASDALASGQALANNASVRSSDGRYTFVQQSDGNLVLYAPGGRALWASHRSGAGHVTYMQTDGNLVTYAPGGRAVWASGTNRPGSRLVVQNDGNVVIYAPEGRATWATRTVQDPLSGSTAMGDDYPASWRNGPMNRPDDYGYLTRQCTSFVAFRLATRNGFTMPRAIGDAGGWGGQMMARGYAVDRNPRVGSIAWTPSGHVAWVAGVGNGTVTIEEYNYGFTGAYNRRTVSVGAFSYIHVKDL